MAYTRRAVLIAVLTCTVACAQEELLLNGSFEVGDGGLPAFWEARTPNDADREMLWAKGVAHSGARSLQITNHPSIAQLNLPVSRWRAGHEQDVALQPGSEVTLSAWVRTEGAEAAQVQIYIMGEGGKIIAQPGSAPVTGDSDWTQVSVSATAPDEPHYVMAYLNLRGPGRAWFDDVTMVGVPGPTMPTRSDPISYTVRDFEDPGTYETVSRSGREVFQPPQGATGGQATAIFWHETARYDLTLLFIDEPDGASTFRVSVNGTEIGSVVADKHANPQSLADEVHEYTIPDVDLQHLSRITVSGEIDAGELARVFGLRLVRTGRFRGELRSAEDLPMPENLRVYQTPVQRRSAAGMLARYVNPIISARNQAVQAERDALTTPEQVRAWQADTRARLGEFFGRWPEPTPLNPRTVGQIDLDFCTIEKVILETEPGYFVPLNFYIPKDHPLPAPAVCITSGHSAEGKGYHLYHEFALGLARKGYIACAFDPMGQGERITYDQPPEELGARGGPVGQHHYLLRPGYLVGRSLSGLRTWDGVRVVDYMLTRPEVDPERVAVGGNSGGGQMTLLITACHPQVALCAAAHPGGSCENTYYLAKRDLDLRIIGLIPPRPCRWIVGDQSGEEIGHRSRYDWLQPLYDILGASEANDFQLVDGVHNLERPKRESAYDWYNHWLGMDAGMTEDPLEPLAAEQLWCTEHGSVECDLGGLREDQVNARLMREMAPIRPQPPAAGEGFLAQRRASVLAKVALDLPAEREAPFAREAGTCPHEALTIEKLVIATEPGIECPALLMRSKSGAAGPPIIWTSENGKPAELTDECVPLRLALSGRTVLAVDVRGTGELDIEGGEHSRVVEYDAIQWRRDGYGIALTSGGKTLLGQRALDVIRCMDWLAARGEMPGGCTLVGEGEAGTWALVAAIADERVAGVATIGMLGSYRMILDHKWNNVRGYFWVPKALEAYDLPDLPALVAPRPVALINTVDQMMHPLDDGAVHEEYAWARSWYDAVGAGDALTIASGADVEAILDSLK